MRKSKHYVKKRGGSPMHINRNAQPMNQMPMNQMPMDNMQMNNNMQMNQMDMDMDNGMPNNNNMPVNQMPNNNCPPCVCPPGNDQPENKPASLKDKVMGFNNALATKPGEFFGSIKSNSLDAYTKKKDELSDNIIGFLQKDKNPQPNIGGRRRRTRKRATKRKHTRRRGAKRRATKTKRRRHTRR